MSTTSSTSSSSVASFYTSNGTTRLNGSELISGLDTQSLITAMTMKTQSKIDTQGQLEQKAQWKQQMYQAVQSLMVSFNGTYFSYANSGSNIMSSKFFDSGSLISSSKMVSATGSSSSAGNVVINNITSLAKSASMTSSYAPSVPNITSGAIRTSWTQSNLSGKSLSITYGGNSYTLMLGSSASLDSTAGPKDNLQSIADALNTELSSSASLNGNLLFSVTGNDTDGYSLKLSTTSAAKSTSFSLGANSSDKTSADFLSAIGLSAGNSTDGAITGSAVTDSSLSSLYSKTVSSSSNLVFSVDGNSYTVTLGSDVDLSTDTGLSTLITDLQSKIAANSNLSGITVTGGTSDGASVSFDGSGFTIKGGSQNLLNGLGLTANGDGTYSTSGTVSKNALTNSYLGDTLAGTTLSVSLNGVSKNITFNSTDESSYSTASGLQSYLQSAFNTSFGNGKVTVGLDAGSRLTFTTADSTSILALASSSASNVLTENGALRIGTGETNRLEITKTLNELSGELNSNLSADSNGNFSITVNGKAFTFSGNTELGTVINTINSDSDAGVNIKFSQTLNRFTVTADDTGSQEQISIKDTGGNLAASLFGTDYSGVYQSALSAGVGAINSTALSAAGGEYSSGGNDSTYTFQLGDGTAQSITIAGNQTYGSLSDFAAAIQSSVNANSALKGNVTVGVSSDGTRLTFNVSSSESAGTTLTVAKSSSSSGDILGLGSSAASTTDASQTSLADLYTDGVSGITQTTVNEKTVYQVGSLTFGGSTTLAGVGYDGYSAGTDLVMSATLGGSSTATTVTRSTNSFTLDGITMNVTGTTDSPVTFTSNNNVDDLYTKISDFVTAYNNIIDKVNTYVTQQPYGLSSSNGGDTYAPLTDAQKKEMTDSEISDWNEKAQQGLLDNDQTLSSILSGLRESMERTVSSAGISLSSIGISTAAYDFTSGGKLVINETALKSALQTEPDKISDLFTGTNGIASNVKSVLTNYVGEYGNSGILYQIAGSSTSTTTGSSQLDMQISQYNTTIKNLKTTLSDQQDYWQAKFTTMETKLSTLNSQYSYLSSMLGGTSS